MRQWLAVFVVAFAVATLPFGMGAMMQANSAEHCGQTHLHGADQAKLPHSMAQGGAMQFMVCGACLLLPSAVPVVQAWSIGTDLLQPGLTPRFTGTSTLPATPPPRA